MKSRFNPTKIALMFWTLFIGLGALWGSVMMFLAPDGSLLRMDGLSPYFKVLPLSNLLYQNYIFPGIALLLINGIPNLVAFYLLMKKKKKGVVLGGILGVTLMLWITIQFVIFPSNILSQSYFIFGLIQALTGYMAYVFLSQESMNVRIEDYPNIGRNGKNLVVFFSRLGYTRRVAYEEASRLGGDMLEIKSKERTDGTLGFWWCGRFGMHSWPMEIESIDTIIEDYDSITVCSPVWVFGPSAPIREFLTEYKGKIKRMKVIITHFQFYSMKSVIRQMEEIAGMEAEENRSIGTRLGRVREEYII
ncbi:MAG: flavodoxin family protein [Candidatus Ornithospirochaeta sp.]